MMDQYLENLYDTLEFIKVTKQALSLGIAIDRETLDKAAELEILTHERIAAYLRVLRVPHPNKYAVIDHKDQVVTYVHSCSSGEAFLTYCDISKNDEKYPAATQVEFYLKTDFLVEKE